LSIFLVAIITKPKRLPPSRESANCVDVHKVVAPNQAQCRVRNPFVVANRTWAVAAPVRHVRQVGVEYVPVVQVPHTIGTRSPVNSANLPADSQSGNDKLNENRVGGATEVMWCLI
jgi:hypothetical protein